MSSHEQQTSKHSDTRQAGENSSSDPEYRHVPNHPSLITYYIGFQLLAFCEISVRIKCALRSFVQYFFTVLLSLSLR